MVKRRALVIMARQPTAGMAKTRLCPPLSPAAAAELYACFLRDTVAKVAALDGVTWGIAHVPAAGGPYFAALAPSFDLVAQTGRSLSERLDGVLRHYLDEGFHQVVAINSDSPTLPPAHLTAAFARLDDPATDVVFGPCVDGGYYLIGIKRPPGPLVRDVPMSTPTVLQDSLAIAAGAGLATSLLPAWYDVDDDATLSQLRAEVARDPGRAPATATFLRHQIW